MSEPTKFELLRKSFVDEYINDPNDPREVWFDPANNRVIREVKMPFALRAIGLLKDSFAVERIEDTTVIQRKLLFPNNMGSGFDIHGSVSYTIYIQCNTDNGYSFRLDYCIYCILV